MPNAELPENDNGWPGWNWPAAVPRVGPRVDGGAAKFVRLKMLKISALNSILRVSAKGNFWFTMTLNWRKLGPRKKLRGRFPNAPAFGIAKAAGLNNERS